MKDNVELLKDKMLNSDKYPKITDNFWKRFFEDISTDPKTIILIVSGIITLLTNQFINFPNQNIRNLVNVIAIIIVLIFFVVLIGGLYFKIKNIIVELSKSKSKSNE